MFQKLCAAMHGKNRSKKAFTLAELLIVIAIIGILVAIAVPVFSAQLGKARDAVAQANKRTVKAMAATDYLTDKTEGAATYYYAVDNTTGDVTKETDATAVSGSTIYTVKIDSTGKVTVS